MSANQTKDELIRENENLYNQLKGGKRSHLGTWPSYIGPVLIACGAIGTLTIGAVAVGYSFLELYVSDQLSDELLSVRTDYSKMEEQVSTTRSDLKELEKAASNLAPLAVKIEATYLLLESKIDTTNDLIDSTNSKFEAMEKNLSSMNLFTINERIATAQSTADQANVTADQGNRQFEDFQGSVEQKFVGIQAGMQDDRDKQSQLTDEVTELKVANVLRGDSQVATDLE